MNRKFSYLTTAFLLLIGIAVFVASCNEDDPEPDMVATQVELVSGSIQPAMVGAALANPIEIIIKDQEGNPFAGAKVNFAVEEGSVSKTSATTDQAGKVSVEWTLGATVGIQTLTIIAYEADGVTPLKGSPVTVTVTTKSLPEASSIEIVSGGDQESRPDFELPEPIVVKVKDQYGNPFAGTKVNFEVTEGSVSSASVSTDADGIASVVWTTGATEGTQTLAVKVFEADGTTEISGSPLSVNCTCAMPLLATTLELINTGIGQIAIKGEMLTNPLMIFVADQNGDPFEGATVHFSLTEGSVFYIDPVTSDKGSVFQYWTLGTTEGLQTLTISAYQEDGTTHLEGSPIVTYANACNTVADIEGNVYKTLTYGDQIWMVENLKVTKYNDGTEIALLESESAWFNTTDPAYCWYDNDIANKEEQGALYNLITLYSNIYKEVCPVGWHVPSSGEWDKLRDYLIANDFNYDGTTTGNKIAKALAATGVNWAYSDIEGAPGNYDYKSYKNKSGFSAVPTGSRYIRRPFLEPITAKFENKGAIANWWMSNVGGMESGITPCLWWTHTDLFYNTYDHKAGLSIRCVKD